MSSNIERKIKLMIKQFMQQNNISIEEFAEFVSVPIGKIEFLINKPFDAFQDKVYLKIYVQKIIDRLLVNVEQKNELTEQLNEYCKSELQKETEHYERKIETESKAKQIEKTNSHELSDKFKKIDPLYFETKQNLLEEDFLNEKTKVLAESSSKFNFTKRMDEIDRETKKELANNAPRRRSSNNANKDSKKNKGKGNGLFLKIIIGTLSLFAGVWVVQNYILPKPAKTGTTTQETKKTTTPVETPKTVAKLEYKTTPIGSDNSYNRITLTEPKPTKAAPMVMKVVAKVDMEVEFRYSLTKGAPLEPAIKIKAGETSTINFEQEPIFLVITNGDDAKYTINNKEFKLPGVSVDKGYGGKEQWIEIVF